MTTEERKAKPFSALLGDWQNHLITDHGVPEDEVIYTSNIRGLHDRKFPDCTSTNVGPLVRPEMGEPMRPTCQWRLGVPPVPCGLPSTGTVFKPNPRLVMQTREVCEAHLARALDLGWERPPDHAIKDITNLLLSWAEALPIDQLQAVIDTPQALTATNCWYHTYNVAPALAVIAQDIMRTRQWTIQRGFVAWFAQAFTIQSATLLAVCPGCVTE